jgi:HEPN domain-containing protein
MKKKTRAWIKKAEDDFQLAQSIAQGNRPFHDQLCFHCQQSAEKYCKAILEEDGIAIPKTHDLDRLLILLQSGHPTLRAYRRGLLFLTNFAVPVRYPGANATKRQGKAAFRWAERIRQAVAAVFGVSWK